MYSEEVILTLALQVFLQAFERDVPWGTNDEDPEKYLDVVGESLGLTKCTEDRECVRPDYSHRHE